MLVDNKDGTITDTSTNLMWKQEPEIGKYSWIVACKITSDYAGFNDWRMPTVKELQGIVDYGRVNPAIDTSYFPNTSSSYFWSGSPFANYSSYAWYVHFFSGYADYDDRGYGLQVRLVRNKGND